MKLVPTRPVTIEKAVYGERWFPRMFRHSDGSLLMYVEYGHDSNFAPDFRLQSHDNGKSWHTPTDNVPRACWSHSFADGELFEVDAYCVHDPKAEHEGAYFGAWSHPGRPDLPVRKEHVRIHAPSFKKVPLRSLTSGGRTYPTFHWWPLWNKLHGNDELKGDEINLMPAYFGTGVELADGRLLALVYAEHNDPAIKKCCVFCVESRDRGHNWKELSMVARDDSAPEGPDEATMVQLKDGRLYAVMRTGSPSMLQAWSSDGGKTWTEPTKVTLVDEPAHQCGKVWPVMKKLADGTLVMVYGRPGKNLVFDPSGTGTQWQGRLDMHKWELETQAIMGVPADKRINNAMDEGVRYWNSGDYLFLVTDGPRRVLCGYDVQGFVENWNAKPFSGVRMLSVTLAD